MVKQNRHFGMPWSSNYTDIGVSGPLMPQCGHKRVACRYRFFYFLYAMRSAVLVISSTSVRHTLTLWLSDLNSDHGLVFCEVSCIAVFVRVLPSKNNDSVIKNWISAFTWAYLRIRARINRKSHSLRPMAVPDWGCRPGSCRRRWKSPSGVQGRSPCKES